jgi:hypothetical protein
VSCNNKNNIYKEEQERLLTPMALWMSAANPEDSIIEEIGVLCPPIPTTPSSHGEGDDNNKTNKNNNRQLATCVLAMG